MIIPIQQFEQFQQVEKVEINPDAPEIERLRSQNPIYADMRDKWDLYLSAYEGGASITNHHHVFKHQRENVEDFEDRVKRLHYINYCGPLVDFFTSFIFTETIQRDFGSNSTFFREFVNDVDRRGSNINAFMRTVSDDMQIFGMSYVLVDSPQRPDSVEVVSKFTEKQLAIRPYWVLIKPTEVLDWVADPFDSLEYLKRVQVVTERDGNRTVTFEKYTEFLPDKITVNYIDVSDRTKPILRADKRQELANQLGIIPIEVCRYRRSKRVEWLGDSFLRDLASNNKEVMNLTSLLQEFLYRQCFNVLAKEVDSMIPEAGAESGIEGTSNVLEYPKGAHAPSYITPPSDPAHFLQDERRSIVAEMYRHAAQDTMNELFNGGKSSGFSQAQSFSKTVPFIATRADALQDTEYKLYSLTLQYSGTAASTSGFDGKVKYKDRYELTNITDALSQLTMLFRDLAIPSPTFVKQEMKRLVHELDDKISPDLMAQIENEIDSMDFAQWQQIQEEALVGRGVSIAEQQKPKSSGTMAELKQESNNAPAGPTKQMRPRQNKQ